jgi:hypothetical protein
MDHDVPLTDFGRAAYFPRVAPGSGYYLQCKYQSDLSRTPRLFHLMLLDAVITPIGEFYSAHFDILALL